ncbi:uncharacterized protein ACNLHF_007748 [Anomaloglossus baeobatrachus]|uniref:uncharacterized protein LOC142254865 n=1 Tax=Anomaloglossus baeobatrachus TaxID=238106 RepID=UPI003F4F4A33
MPSCVVRGCDSTKKPRDPSRILHGFPNNREVIKLWLQQTGQYDIDLEKKVEKVFKGKLHNSYRMCSLHFTHDSYRYKGCRRRLRKDAIPSVFTMDKTSTGPSLESRTTQSVSGPSSTYSEHHTPSVSLAENQKSSSSSTVYTYRVEVPVVPPMTTSQPTVLKMTVVPVGFQHGLFQGCGASQNSDPVVHNKLSTVAIALTASTQKDSAISEAAQAGGSGQKSPPKVAIETTSAIVATQKGPTMSGVSQQSSISRASTPSIVEPSSSSSSCIQDRTFANSEVKVSHGGPVKQLTPVELQQTIFTVMKKKSTSVLTNPNLPLNTMLISEAKSLSTKPSLSTAFSSPVISLPPTPVISNPELIKAPSINIPLSAVNETKPCAMTVHPASGKVSTVTQTPPTSGLTPKPPSISVVHVPPASQTAIPYCVPPSKKRKLEENVFLKLITPSFSAPNVLPCQTSVNTGNFIFMPHGPTFMQPPCLIQKPLMVDKGVNTDFFSNRKKNAYTQTKIYTNFSNITCSLSVASETSNNSESTTSLPSPENTGFSDSYCYSSDNDPCEDLQPHSLDPVKMEILSDSEVDASRHMSSDRKPSIRIKEEDESSAGQSLLPPTLSISNNTIPDFDNRTLKKEPNIKIEEDQYPISSPAENITKFTSQDPKSERISPIPCEPLVSHYRNPTSWENFAVKTDNEQEDPSDSSFHINELSEDEDELFLAPSDDEDDVKRVFQDLDSPVENPVEEEKYLVFESCLKKLIMMIPCMSETKCTSPLTHYRKETIGSYLSVEVRCRSGHTRLLWESQPRHGYQPLGNVLLSAAVLLSGSSFLKSQHMFKLLNVKSIDKTTYYKNQSMYLFPAINHHWKEEQKAVIRSIRERALCLAGDQQLDNPGFSPKYSVYSLMDMRSKKICSFSVEAVTPEVASETPEKIGFQKTMGDLQTMNADVKMIVTDRSVAVQEILKDNYPSIVHQIDLWHLSKSIGNEVLLAAKQKDCEVLYEWVEAIRNHIWWSSCTCCKNPDMLIQKWKSVLHHVTNVHEWGGDSDCKACHHPPLPEEVVSNTNWLEKDSPAYKQLKNIVENKSLLKDLKQLSFLCHTGELEIYHSACLKYRPKTLHFFMDSMVARTQLAALDHNRNVHRVKEVVKNASSEDALGSGTQRLEASKGQKSWIVKAMYEPACQNILFDIMNDVIALVREDKTLQ